MVALLLLNVVSRRANLDEVLDAFSAGYRSGRRSQPVWSVDWDEVWEIPLEELRAQLQIDRTGIVGDGIRSAA